MHSLIVNCLSIGTNDFGRLQLQVPIADEIGRKGGTG